MAKHDVRIRRGNVNVHRDQGIVERFNFKVDLKSRLKFMGCLVIKVVFKMCQNPPFYLLVVD